jgi:hypothetical protein
MPNAAAPASNPATGTTPWDVNGDAVNDFTFQFRNPQTASPNPGVIWQANMNPAVSGGTQAIAGFTGPFINYGSRLTAGQVIGPVLPAGSIWENSAQVCLGSFYRSGGVTSAYGGFATGATPSASIVRGFVGFRFTIGGNTRYGWLDVEVRGATSAANTGGIFFFGAAYEDSGQSIAAGAVPAPGSLAALAVGAAACLGRKRRSA